MKPVAPYESELEESDKWFTTARIEFILRECLQPRQQDLCRRFLDQPYCWDTGSLQFIAPDKEAQKLNNQDTRRGMVTMLREMQATERTWILRLHTVLRRTRAMRYQKWCMQALEDALEGMLLVHRRFHRWITAEVTQLQGWDMSSEFRNRARTRVGSITQEMIRKATQDPARTWGIIQGSLETQLQRRLTTEEKEVRGKYC